VLARFEDLVQVGAQPFPVTFNFEIFSQDAPASSAVEILSNIVDWIKGSGLPVTCFLTVHHVLNMLTTGSHRPAAFPVPGTIPPPQSVFSSCQLDSLPKVPTKWHCCEYQLWCSGFRLLSPHRSQTRYYHHFIFMILATISHDAF
jgi:hypothetical protein